MSKLCYGVLCAIDALCVRLAPGWTARDTNSGTDEPYDHFVFSWKLIASWPLERAVLDRFDIHV